MNVICKTDKGMKRELNEDYVLTLKGNDYQLLIVADGMGGHNAGEIASKLASMTVRDYVFDAYNNTKDKEELLRIAISKANEAVYSKAQENKNLTGMGTTMTSILITGINAYFGHVGDSRAYIIAENGIRKITQDHSLVQELIDNGSITESEAINHPQRNLITRAVGTEKNVNIDTGCEKIEKVDVILLCSDGLTNYISNDEILEIVKQKKSEAVEELINIANERGGSDNISIILAFGEDRI
jgi:protein phosphatase